MASTSRIGPILVRQSNVVPTPERRAVVNAIDSASAIQVTWDSIRSIDDQVIAGDASIPVATRILMLMESIV